MSIDLDKYTRNFRIFYSKLIGSHPQKQVLEKKFKTLLQNQGNKWRSGLFNKGIDDNKSVKSFLQRAKITQTKQIKNIKIKYQCLMQTSDFQKAFIFCYFISSLQTKSKQKVIILKQKLNKDGVFNQGKILNNIPLRKVSIGWAKLQKLFENSFLVKPHLTIADIVNEFNNQFVEIVFNKLTGDQIDKIIIGEFNEEKFMRVAQITNFTINYFEMERNQLKISKKFNQNKKSIFIGYFKDEKKYVVTKQLPNIKKENVQNQKTFKKFTQISKDLFKMYEQTNTKLNNLDSLISAKQNIYKSAGNQLKIANQQSKYKRSTSTKSVRF